MSGFPNLSNIDSTISKVILDRAGNNLAVSSLQPWFRGTSLAGPGLIIESLTSDDNMDTRYGVGGSSGRIGKFADNKTSYYVREDVRENRPSPTIASVTVQNGSEGLTRKCKFTIKCYTKGQATALTNHFLEPGYYVLIEWGFNTSKSYQQKAGGGGEITVCDLIAYQNLAVLKDKRASSEGTYDAFLGVVTGGQMNYGDDETYEIQVELTSQGELPSYLSNHKGVLIDTEQAASGIKFSPKQIEDAVDDRDNIGKSLFMQMYNKLPLAKQIGNIKKLIDDQKWNNPANFINMDDYLREDYISNLKKTNIKSDGKDLDLKVPNDTPLLSSDSFIRFELAYEILRTTAVAEKIDTGCKDYQVDTPEGRKNLKLRSIEHIDISETKCRAHKHIFSTNKAKLYIPNKFLPDFGITDALSAKPTGSLLTFPSDGNFDESNFIDGHATTGAQQGKSVEKEFYFPRLEDSPLGSFEWDDTIYPSSGLAYQYGYLKDLYINFDFFIESMEKSGFVMYEVMLDILNGFSSAVNLYWDFQIIAGGSKEDGNERMRVVDKTFLGLSKGAVARNESGIPKIVTTTFQSMGVNSPFISVDFSMDIPKETANMVMAQRNDTSSKNADGGSNATPSDSPGSSLEKQPINFDSNLFSSVPCPVAQSLDSINRLLTDSDKEIAESRTSASAEQSKIDSENSNVFGDWSDTKEFAKGAWSVISTNVSIGFNKLGEDTGLWESSEKEEIRNANYDYFVSKAGVFPRGIDRSDVMRADTGFWANIQAAFTTDEQQGISKVLWVGTYDDPLLLKQFELSDFKKSKKDGADSHSLNPVLLPIKFNFTIHGVSGLKVGDIFSVTDLPNKYANRIFQITQVEHEIGDIWTTSIESQMRNV